MHNRKNFGASVFNLAVLHLLSKVLQDYHPDKVDAIHGSMWAFVCNEISKRLNFHFENFK